MSTYTSVYSKKIFMHYINSDIRWQIAMIWSMLSSVMGHRRMKAFDVGNYYILLNLLCAALPRPSAVGIRLPSGTLLSAL